MKLRSTTAVMILLVLMGLTSYSGQAFGQSAQESMNVASIKVSRLPFLSFAPYFIAEAEGYFKDQGLDVEFVSFKRGADAVTALSTGAINVWAGATSVSILSLMDKINVQIVANRGVFLPGGCGYTGFLAKSDLLTNGKIKKPADLSGLKVVQDRPGGLRDYLLQSLLSQNGLTLKDIQPLAVPDPVVIKAFQEGSIDVAVMGEPRATKIINTGSAKKWIVDSDVLPNYAFGVIAFGDRLLTKEPEVGVRFVAGYLNAVKQYKEGKTERNVKILSEATGLDPDLLKAACWPDLTPDGSIDVNQIITMQEWAVANDYLEKVIPPETFWNPTFIQKAAIRNAGK